LDHVALDRLAQPHARVVAFGHDVDQAILEEDLELQPRVPFAECGDHRGDDDGHGGARDRELQAADQLARSSGHFGERRQRLSHGGAGALHQAPPLVGQRDAARVANQERHAELLLELPHRLADRGRGDAELARRAAEAAQAGDGKEHLQLRKRRRLHC
jgi:hypothetical protein